MAIANNNVQNVKFLRNGQVFNTHNDAYNALTAFTLSDEQDGTAILARYTAEDTNVKTLVGWVYKNGNTEYITIQDVEGASSDITALLGGGVTTANTVTMQLTALSGTAGASSAETSVEGAKAYAKDYTDAEIDKLDYTGVTTGTGVYVTNVTEANGVVSATTAELPSTVEPITVAGKPIIAVAEDKGAIAASAGTINAEFVTIADSGEKFTATTVEDALAEVKDAIGTAISGLDKSDSAAAKKFVTSVSEEDGIINVSRGEITSSGKTIVLTDNADGGVNFEANVDGTTIIIDENTGTMSVASSALVQYEGDDDTIQIGAVSDGKRIVSSPLTIQKVTTGLSEIVKEEYHLIGASGNTIGSPVQIYKDSHIVSITYITDSGDTHYQNLEYVYIDASGNTQTTYVDMSELVIEAEFASGVTVTDGVAHGVVDPTSETFLTVGADGFKLAGVQDAINAAVNGLDADVSGNSTHVTVGVVEENGVITGVTVSEDNIANADDLAELSGKTITAITSTNGSITATPDDAVGNKSVNIETDASKIKMSGFTADASGFTAITEATSVKDAVKVIETEIIANEQTTAAALNDLNTRVNTVSGDVDTIKTNYVSGVSVNGNAVTVANNVAPISITAATSATTAQTANAIVVTTGNDGAITLGLNYIDCGTYDN